VSSAEGPEAHSRPTLDARPWHHRYVIRRHDRARDELLAIVTAHSALTGAVVHAARLIAAQHRSAFAAHLDQHRAELNVAVGELGVWAESFGNWAKVDVCPAVYPPVTTDLPARLPAVQFEADLRRTREALKARSADLLAALADSREILRTAGLPVDHLTAYRRVVRLWAGEAVDLVTEVHRLALADRYVRCLGVVSAGPDTDAGSKHSGAALLRQWMHDSRNPTATASWPSPKSAATDTSSRGTAPSPRRNAVGW
jgi:hypothetical protein